MFVVFLLVVSSYVRADVTDLPSADQAATRSKVENAHLQNSL